MADRLDLLHEGGLVRRRRLRRCASPRPRPSRWSASRPSTMVPCTMRTLPAYTATPRGLVELGAVGFDLDRLLGVVGKREGAGRERLTDIWRRRGGANVGHQSVPGKMVVRTRRASACRGRWCPRRGSARSPRRGAPGLGVDDNRALRLGVFAPREQRQRFRVQFDEAFAGPAGAALARRPAARRSRAPGSAGPTRRIRAGPASSSPVPPMTRPDGR